MDDPARALAAAQPGRVFAYRFDWDEEPTVFGSDLSKLLGAAHGMEIGFVFGHWQFGREGRVLFDAENEPGRAALAAAMMSYWAEFAAHGDPGRGRDGSLPRWAPWQEDGEKYAVLDTPAGGGVRMSTSSERLADVTAAVLADPSFADEDERCEVLGRLADWAREQSVESPFASADAERCAAVVPADVGG